MSVYRSNLYPDYPDVTTVGTTFRCLGTNYALSGIECEISDGDIAVFYRAGVNGIAYFIQASSKNHFQFRSRYINQDGEYGDWSDWRDATQCSINDKTLYGYSLNSIIKMPLQEVLMNGTYVDSFTSLDTNTTAYIRWYGNSQGGTATIPVQWQTEYRTEPYEATFQIEVNADMR